MPLQSLLLYVSMVVIEAGDRGEDYEIGYVTFNDAQ